MRGGTTQELMAIVKAIQQSQAQPAVVATVLVGVPLLSYYRSIQIASHSFIQEK